MRSAWVIPTLPYGLRYWEAFFDALEKRRHRFLIYTYEAPPEGLGRYPARVLPAPPVPLPRRAAIDRGNTVRLPTPRLCAEIVRERPDVVVGVEYSLGTLWAGLACRLVRRKLLIFTEHRPWDSLLRNDLRTRWRRMLVGLADGFVANTAEARDYLVGQLAADDRTIVTVPLLTPPSRESLCRTPVALPEPRVRPLFLFVGRLVEDKGVEYLLRAARLVREAGEDLSVWIVGGGEDLARLTALTAELRLEDVVTFHGPVPYDGIGHVYARADVFVLPTLSDYRSVSVLEAMRFGLPVLDSRHDGCAASAVHDGDNGFVFEPRDPSTLARLMRRFTSDPGLAPRMGRRSLEIIAEQSPEHAAERFDAAVRALLEGR
ncbi:MAG TPA: glycosyltransferase family 4 protein [Thermodesulfobacteriota bacterium]